ncbi:hypothetical protein BJ742DRAFT_741332 [Cladochytrium replicatum]|nr:hypothetical protein BJ742DRAFT_741332 [Cladochytrium replicatum]
MVSVCWVIVVAVEIRGTSDGPARHWDLPLFGFFLDREKVETERSRTLNNDFDKPLKVQRIYTIPDSELRAEIIKDVKSVLIPRFHYKHCQQQKQLSSRRTRKSSSTAKAIEFSKNPEKFFKYDKGSLEKALEKFFDSS